MWSNLGLKTRLNLTIAALLVGVALCGSLVVIHRVRAAVAQETEAAWRLACELIGAVSNHAPLAPYEVSRWQTMLEGLNRFRHVRFIINPPPSASAKPKMPGVPSWFARWVQPPPRRANYVIPIQPTGALQVILVAAPQDEIAEAWQETKLFLSLIALLAVGFFLAVVRVLGRAVQPVEVISKGLSALEHGDYAARLPSFAFAEFNRIAHAFNHLAQALAQAQSENRRLTRQLLKVEEEERRQLARELHDELGQTLSAIKVMARSILNTHPSQPISQAAKAILASTDQLFQLLRSMIQKLRPLLLDELGLTSAIANLIASWRAHQTHTQLEFRCDEVVDAFPQEGWIHVYRIVQEALTNAFKHAQANLIQVELSRHLRGVPASAWLKIEVRDDGQGAQLEALGFGLEGMRERVESLGGSLELNSQVGKGFQLVAWLPYDQEERPCSRSASC